MKALRLILLLSLPFSGVFAQCPAPEVLNWQFTGEDNVTVVADFPEGTTSYEMSFVSLYFDNFPPALDTLTFTGSASPGTAALEFDPTSIVPVSLPAENYYYEALLTVQCDSGTWSEVHQFYVSPVSLLNNPGTACDLPFTAIQYLADGAGFAFQHEIEVPGGDTDVFVEDLSVLVDIGHSYNGDLRITLTSPSGTTIDLLTWPNGFGNTSGMSLLFTDSGNEISGPVGAFAPSESLSAFHGEPVAGFWILTVIDNIGGDDGYFFGGCLNINASPCVSSIAGKAYYDVNINNSQEIDEPAFSHALIENTLDGSLFFADSAGKYFRCSDAGPLNLALADTPAWYVSAPGSHDVDVVSGDALTGLDFALVADGEVFDLNADMYSVGFDRPGFSNSYIITCTNQGNTCVDNVTLEAELDALLSITDVMGGESSAFTANTVTATIGTLCPTQSTTIQVFHSLPDTVSLGTELHSSASLLPLSGDGHAYNNMAELASVVIGSYDPNDKQVSKKEVDESFMENDEYLYYHIRFQNTGTFYAEFVTISDTIDDLLDFSTFELLDVSHNVQLTSEGRKIDFNFDNIFLPDSATDLEGSQGFARYRIKPKSEFALGDTISNTAYIFFDFNEAIITNTVTTVWSQELGTVSDRHVPGVFPNPATSILNVWIPGPALAGSYTVYTLAGKRVKQGRIAGGERAFSIGTDDLTPGIYFLHLDGEANFKPVKWVKI